MSYTLAPITLTVGHTAQVSLPGQLSDVTYVKLVNASPYLVQLSNVASGQDYLQPGEANVWKVDGLTSAILATALQFATAPSLVPVSVLVVTWFGPGEQPSGNYPVNFNLLSYTGNTLLTAQEVINDGFSSGTNVVEATPNGASSSYVLIRNDGTLDIQAISNGALADMLHITPGTAITPASLILKILDVLGASSLDSGLVKTDGAGTLTLTQSDDPNSQLTIDCFQGLGFITHSETGVGSSGGNLMLGFLNGGGTTTLALQMGDFPFIPNPALYTISSTGSFAGPQANGAFLLTGLPQLISGSQDTGGAGFAWPATAAQSYVVWVPFHLDLVTAPSSITLTPISQTNISSAIALDISRYGFALQLTSTGAGVARWIGSYTTVGH